MRMKTTALAALLATTPLTVLAQDQVLNIYNWSDYIAEDTIANFEQEFGVSVNYDVYDSNEVLEARLFAGNSGFDIVVPTSDFLRRQAAAGIYQPLDRSKLPNLENMDPALMEAAAVYDPGNEHSVIYMWGTTGIGYNVGKVAEILGDDAPTDSWDMIFNPEIIEQLSECGVTMLDAPTEMLPAAMNYLGLDPRSTASEDMEAAAELLETIRPHIRYFHSSQYISDLANGDVCVSVGWSGDVFQALYRAEEAENGVEIAYVIPSEGALQWFDLMAIPADAPNPDLAHEFINFVMRPDVTADITNYVWYANGNAASLELVDPDITSDPGIFPTEAASERLWAAEVYDARTDRLVNRLWTQVKTGQ
ncbi:polyamine ABC transporter substrate-binding protein [Pontivivens insulae]|uniref:Putrescine-binding periplasmic protein n=1 Tax=Pontivivens insulae TaxID=1639689 RepID=A0A2R8ACX9_9RHOB|nr:polyamine ABC transporter substrate-binding protein [Pontivivens insulae]RED14022.1 spermidine/putrescine-binding protein [Pontivivens insulae]SPF30096.1 Putrescine-binding periplasmic protein [Pontivivens insulae]